MGNTWSRQRIAMGIGLSSSSKHYWMTYDYTVKATDVAGTSTVVTESVDRKTTLQPTTLQLNNQSDLMTNQPLPTLSGQSEPHATIQVSLSGEILRNGGRCTGRLVDYGHLGTRVGKPLAQGAGHRYCGK
ncbi:hypothetical protein AB6E88_07865 [Providencia hangzhouensis]